VILPPNVAKGHQKQYEPGHLLKTWYLAVFQKKLGTKLFILTLKKNIAIFFFYLVLALESISGVKSWFFGKNKFCPKNRGPSIPPLIQFSVKNCQIIIFHSGEKYFFPFKPKKISLILKLPTVAKGHQKQYEPGHLLGTWYLAVFQKKIGTKLFILTLKKKYGYILFLLSFGRRVDFQRKKLIFWQKKKFRPKNLPPFLLA
jgi:hypothetical protein